MRRACRPRSCERSNSKKAIVAWSRLSSAMESFLGQWKQSLQRQLPHYMVPSEFVPFRSFPTTPSGKVDVQALDAMRLRAARFPFLHPTNSGRSQSKPGSRKFGRDSSKSTPSGSTRTSSLWVATPCWQHGCWFRSSSGSVLSSPTPCWWNIRRFVVWQLTSARAPAGKWPALVTIQAGAFLPPLFIAHGHRRKSAELYRACCRAGSGAARVRSPAPRIYRRASSGAENTRGQLRASRCARFSRPAPTTLPGIPPAA